MTLKDLWVAPDGKRNSLSKSVSFILQRYMAKGVAQGYTAQGRKGRRGLIQLNSTGRWKVSSVILSLV